MARVTPILAIVLLITACGSSTPPQRTSLLRTMASESSKGDAAAKKEKESTIAMAPFTESGFELRGAEYWPYVGATEPRYPEDVLWGFYPKKGELPPGETDPNADTASPAAVRCAQRAFTELHRFIANRPKDLDVVVDTGKDRGVTRLFYLWVNDYTRAADPYPPGVRPARLWYWKRKVADPKKPDGYWKWESTLNQRGECITPNADEAATYLREKREEIGKP
jgi:hypothetical protein